ncbi:hypothetical protein A2642_01445 [Candidatus Nomurabacteria bacterium RIFCSPHIGHO2_01_FULL_39_10]|uniref:Uncharacterized protein n=1 Tax=Candidatus Nomurabacteria bacterium RIFCSPHIGHO2_01_FULL_39_10 TaxID=1801733 RepID=A0A1F6V9R0_9BACT|nr:MAG: hypothetical protein A2642_01445 [Candidatus Nomurabacteria bacterium RIFCSPHIGHO2_01_FULL_39_10]
MENTTPKTSTQTPIKEINYVLTAQEAQKIKILVAKEIKKFQQRIIELESENIMLKQQLGVTSDEPSTREEFTEQNPIVG